MVQAALVTVVAIPFGFVLYPLQVLVGLAILAVFGVGMGALSYALAIASRKREWMFWIVQQSLLFPLLILSGMMLPIESGPGWMQALAKVNPLTYIVDAARHLFSGSYPADTVAAGFGGAAVIAVLGLVVGLRSMRHSS